MIAISSLFKKADNSTLLLSEAREVRELAMLGNGLKFPIMGN